MAQRALRPWKLNVTYTLPHLEEEAGPSSPPNRPKAQPKPVITKNHSAAKKSSKSSKHVPEQVQVFNPSDLPDAPWFEPLVHRHPLHKAYNKLPPALRDLDVIEPVHIFQLFFTNDILETISTNTNLYAAHKRRQKNLPEGKGRLWTDVTALELGRWLGIVIYMGIVDLPAVRDYWRHDGLWPPHDICKVMSQTRFEDVRENLHIAPPNCATHNPTGKKRLWHQKVDPLLNQLRHAAQSYRIPSSNISIDEAIIRCTGRFSDTYKTPFKPIPQGYKFHCCADHGYIIDFHPTSNKTGPDPFSSTTTSEGLSDTSSVVLEMISHLPKNMAFNVYFNNYYTTLPLVSVFRTKGIEACGTSQTNSKDFPSSLIVPKNALAKLDYHYQAGVVVEGVAVMLWIDNAPVSMMTSIHQLKGRKSEVYKVRRKPGPKSTNAAGIKKAKVFSAGEWSSVLNIPACIDDYNHHMGGVDIADQYRAYYDTQLVSRRTWLPIFFWCTDTALIDSFIIFLDIVGNVLEHKQFRMQVAWGLVQQSIGRGSGKRKRKIELEEDQNSDSAKTSRAFKRPYVTKKRGLPEPLQGGMHLPQRLDGRRRCILCRWKRVDEGEEQGLVSTDVPQTIWKCGRCEHPLCLNDKRNCFTLYHTLDD